MQTLFVLSPSVFLDDICHTSSHRARRLWIGSTQITPLPAKGGTDRLQRSESNATPRTSAKANDERGRYKWEVRLGESTEKGMIPLVVVMFLRMAWVSSS